MSSLNEGLVEAGAEVTVLTTDASGSARLDVVLGDKVPIRGVDVMYLPVSKISPPGYFFARSAGRICEALGAQSDVMIVNSVFGNMLRVGVAAGRNAHIPVILSGHGQLLPWALRQKALKKRLYFGLFGRRYLESVFAIHCSGSTELEATRAFGFQGRTFVVPHGLDYGFWGRDPKPGWLRRQFAIPDKGVVALFLGRLHRVKRPEALLGWWAQASGRDDYLVFCGPDEEGVRNRLMNQARAAGKFERVLFTGELSRESVFQALSDSDFLAMPSAMESFGMAALEALSVGVPILTTSNVPMGRWAEEAGAGRVNDGEIGFRDGIRWMLENPDERRRMGRRGKALVRREFENGLVAAKYLAALSEILSDWTRERGASPKVGEALV